MQNIKDDLVNKNLYTDLLDKYGDDFRSLNWGSAESQRKRFEIFASIADLRNSSILDVGCGLSHFYEWLKYRNIEVNYHGIDITPDMIIRSKQKFPEATFSVGTIFDETSATQRQYEYVFASGIFYLRSDNPNDYLKRTVEGMFRLSNRGIAFNCLSAWSNDKDPDEFYADPADVILFCKNLSPKIIFQHHYHPSDFTIFIYK